MCETEDVIIIGKYRVPVPQYIGTATTHEKYAAIRACNKVVPTPDNEWMWDSIAMGTKYGEVGQYVADGSMGTYFKSFTTMMNKLGHEVSQEGFEKYKL